MLKNTFAAVCLFLVPVAAHAMPAIGDMVGTTPADATSALAKSGCTVSDFEAEDGKIEAKCTDASSNLWEVYIDPKTGKVTNVKAGD